MLLITSTLSGCIWFVEDDGFSRGGGRGGHHGERHGDHGGRRWSCTCWVPRL